MISHDNIAYTENGAVSYATAGKVLIDQFAHAGTAMNRPIDAVFTDQEALWNENPEFALRFPFYLRMITRKVKLSEATKTGKVQKGAGLRDEAYKRLLWIAYNHPDVFERNIWLLPLVGSWKDVWSLLFLDVENGNLINREIMYAVMVAALEDDTQADLIRKYMPAICSNNRCFTKRARAMNALAKEFASFLGLRPEEYRKMKASGCAHDFQKIICSQAYEKLNWANIPGKALSSITSGKFLDNHGLVEDYLKWVMSQPVVKFNGYPYELGMKLSAKKNSNFLSPSMAATLYTINKQFDNLIETAKSDGDGLKGNVLCAIDTSGSMSAEICGGPKGLTSFDVCVSLGIYFATLNEGAFHNTVAMFDDKSTIKKISGTFSDKWQQIMKEKTAWGSTNVLSLVEMLVRYRQEFPDVPIEDYPQTLLIVSDMQFNPSGRRSYRSETEETNYEAMKEILRTAFPDEWVDGLKIVWWYCAGREEASRDVPATMDAPGMYLVSGFDGSIVSLLLKTKVDEKTGAVRSLTMEESVLEALSQDVFSFIRS